MLVLFLIICAFCGFTGGGAYAQSTPCARPAAGSTIPEPPDLFSRNGLLQVDLSYNTDTDSAGRTLYCFATPDGTQSPTFHVQPGDRLVIRVRNNLPAPTEASRMVMTTNAADVCGNAMMEASSVNIHYHGTNTAPSCHSDEVIRTLINSGETFTYNVHFPADEPPGLYWYHPHVHGLSEAAVQGGASGAIVVGGIQNRLYPDYTPGVLVMRPEQKQFWRIVNASADAILDLQLQYDGVPQTLQVAALDGVPTDSQNGESQGQLIPRKHVLIPPAGRVEMIVAGPSLNVKQAMLVTLNVPTGPDGDNDPARPLRRWPSRP
jgi:hypothetical protein